MQEAAVGHALTEPEVGARPLLQHEGEILRSHAGLHVADHVGLADHPAGDARERFGGLGVVDGRWIELLVVHLGLGAEGQCHALRGLDEAFAQHGLHLGLEPLDHAVQLRVVRNDRQGLGRAGLEGLEADDRRIDRIDVAAHDGVHGRDDPGGHEDRVDGLLRMGAVPAAALHADREAVDRRHHRPGVQRDGARGQRGPVVQREHLLRGEALEQAVADHLARAGMAFLARLEEEVDGAVEVAGLRQVLRGAQQDRAVPVVPAAVHAARDARAIGRIAEFLDRQCVHVGPQADAAAAGRGTAVQHADHAGAAHVAVHLDAERLQEGGDACGRAFLLEAEFGMRVEVLPQPRQVVVERAHRFDGARQGRRGIHAGRFQAVSRRGSIAT